ncbi:MAG: ABC transporter substrate-binding protein [Marmoricola sp.]
MVNKKLVLVATVVALGMTAAACSSPASSDDSSMSGGGGDAAETAAKELGIDLADCPTDPTKKFGKGVVVGNTVALSGGPAAAFGPVRAGVSAAINQMDAEAGYPTKFKLEVKDDQFMPDKALAGVQELVEKNKADVITNILGSAQVLATRQYLNDNCVPLITATGNSADSSNTTDFPWVVNNILQNPLDVRVWIADAQERFPNGGKVALLTSNTESGKDNETQIKRFLKGTKLKLVKTQSIEAADAGTPSSQITTLRSSGADILFLTPIATQCPTALKEVANQGWKPEMYVTNGCVASGIIGAAGPAAEGVHGTIWLKDPLSPRWSKDQSMIDAVAAIKKYGDPTLDTVSAVATSGYTLGQGLTLSIKAASKSPLGLSRLGLLDAAQHLNFQPALALPGVHVRLDGLRDQVAIEAAYLQTWNTADGGWDEGKLHDFEGQLTP